MGLGQLLGPIVAQAHRTGLARSVELRQRGPVLLFLPPERRRPVQLRHVQHVPLEPLQRPLGRTHVRVLPDAPRVGRQLGRHPHLLLPRHARRLVLVCPDELPQQHLSTALQRPRAVRVRRVEPVHAPDTPDTTRQQSEPCCSTAICLLSSSCCFLWWWWTYWERM